VTVATEARSDDSKIFKESYTEVLLFLKHQDDKINRVLTALAFLTAAGVTLYIFGRAKPAPDFPVFANAQHVTVDDYFFGSFLFGLFFALAFAIVALDPTSVVPRYLHPTESTSILFWHAIARRTTEEWNGLRGQSAAMSLADSFHADARRLSHRAAHKVRRFGQATAFVQFTVASLALLGLMRLNHVSMHGRWVLTTGLVTAYSGLPIMDLVYQRRLNFPGVGCEYVSAPARGRMWFFAKLYLFFVPFFVVSAVALVLRFEDWEPVTFALFGALLLRLVAHEVPAKLAAVSVVFALAVPACEAAWLWGFS
jgi:hypothetical protein